MKSIIHRGVAENAKSSPFFFNELRVKASILNFILTLKFFSPFDFRPLTFWLLAIGYWLLAIGYWLLAFGF